MCGGSRHPDELPDRRSWREERGFSWLMFEGSVPLGQLECVDLVAAHIVGIARKKRDLREKWRLG